MLSVGVTPLPTANELKYTKIINGQQFCTIICTLNDPLPCQKRSRFPLNVGIFYVSPFAYFFASHKTDSQFALTQLSLGCLKLGHHISRHNYSQNLSETNLLSVAVPLLCMNSELSAGQAEIKNRERAERKCCGSCGRPNRSMGDKRMSNKPMMNPEWSLLWGPGLLLTNALLTWRMQPVIEIHSVSEREEECER